MLTLPVFRLWRPLWDAELGSATRRLDELAAERQRGRTSPPAVPPEIIRRVTSDRARSLIQGGSGLSSKEAFAELEHLRPLIEAAVWPRWLLLEAALEESAATGSLHLAALVLRTQIEELDALQDVSRILTLSPASVEDGQSLTNGIAVLTTRVLPRLRAKSEKELLEAAGEAPGGAQRSPRLQRSIDALGDYVHPNYGSHVLLVRPHSTEAASVIIEAFVAVYEAFLSLPWAGDVGSTSADAFPSEGRPFEVLAETSVPALARACGADIGIAPWPSAVACLRQQVLSEESLNAEAEAVESGGVPEASLNFDVGAILALRKRGAPRDTWPVPISTAAERLRYASLVEDERRLVADVANMDTDPGAREPAAWLPLMCSALTFSINITEFKLDTMGRQAARLLNAENLIGATLVIRSMLEHHAVAVVLSKKLRTLWERIERTAPDDNRVAALLGDAEKQLARVLAGSPESQERSAAWRALWQGSVKKYHVLEPVKATDKDQPGYLKTYGLFSHIVHGTTCTGGDLLGEGGVLPVKHQLLQLVLFLSELCTHESMLDRQAGSMLIAQRLAVTARESAGGIGARIAEMRLPAGQKLKSRSDVNGAGTEDDPFRFRRGLLYHSAYHHWLQQHNIQVRDRMLHRFPRGIGDRVETEDGRVLYFQNDSWTSMFSRDQDDEVK